MAFLLIKIFLTAYVLILIPIYLKFYGPQNFLWLSDVGLFMTVIGIWLESPLLISMVVIGILPVEIIWNIDYFVQLMTGKNFFGITQYMFEKKYPLYLRGLSLFHIFLPVICILLLIEWGYDTRAFMYQSFLTTIILLLTYFLTTPSLNINWVFTPKVQNWYWMPNYVWLLILIIGFSVLIYWPVHIFLKNNL